MANPPLRGRLLRFLLKIRHLEHGRFGVRHRAFGDWCDVIPMTNAEDDCDRLFIAPKEERSFDPSR